MLCMWGRKASEQVRSETKKVGHAVQGLPKQKISRTLSPNQKSEETKSFYSYSQGGGCLFPGRRNGGDSAKDCPSHHRGFSARCLGGEFFTTASLKGLLENPKYRGSAKFKDTWNQFPQLQDDDGMVRWEYAHGVIIDEATAADVNAVIASMRQRNPKKSKYNGFLLTGILVGEDGSRYHGDPAKSGANPYYYNKTLKQRIPCEELDDLVVKRVKEYLEKQGVIEGVINNFLKHKNVGVPFLEEEKTRLRNKIRDLARVVESFSETLRQAALAGQNVAELAQSLLDERKKAEEEKAV